MNSVRWNQVRFPSDFAWITLGFRCDFYPYSDYQRADTSESSKVSVMILL